MVEGMSSWESAHRRSIVGREKVEEGFAATVVSKQVMRKGVK